MAPKAKKKEMPDLADAKQISGKELRLAQEQLEAAVKEVAAYKKAKEENDERFMRERDEARAEVEVLQRANSKLVDELTETGNQRAALTSEADDAASRIVELQAQLQQKLSPAEACREERAEGNGGCGTCAICCNELKAELFEIKATLQKEVADIRAQLLEAKKAAQVVTGYDGVMKEIQDERARQDVKWGQQNHPDGTCAGPGGAVTAKQHADSAKSICNHHAKIGQLTWMHILTEEMLEAFAETDQAKLRTELIQSAAVATAWAECIDRRQSGRKSGE